MRTLFKTARPVGICNVFRHLFHFHDCQARYFRGV